MIISHSHRFIFVKTMKTAGTSIEAYLSPHCGVGDVLTPLKPPVPGHVPRNYVRRVPPSRDPEKVFFNHMPASSIKRIVGSKLWEQYFTFCVERDPWDRTISYFHMQQARGYRSDFGTFLREEKLCHNFYRYTDQQKKPMVDRILRFENLNEDLADVFGRLRIPFDGTLEIRAKSNFRRDRSPYRLAYDSDQRKTVETVFADEIQLLGYEFDSAC